MTTKLPEIIARDSSLAANVRPLLTGQLHLKASQVKKIEAMEAALRDAKIEAQKTLEEARKEAETLRTEAIEAGKTEGLATWLGLIEQASDEYRRLQQDAERDMVSLAFHIARRLIGHAIDVDPTIVRDLVGAALTAARGHRQILVLVHPDDLTILESEPQKLGHHRGKTTLHFQASPDVERGGCLIETETGRIDARLQTRLDTLFHALLEPQ